MAGAALKPLVALRGVSLPKEGSRDNIIVPAGDEFTPVSEESRERLLRVGAAAEPGSKEAKRAKARADLDEFEDDDE